MHFSRYIINNEDYFSQNISCFLKYFQQVFHSRILLRPQVRQGGQQRALHRRGVRVLRAASVAGQAAGGAALAPPPPPAPRQEASGGAGLRRAHPRQPSHCERFQSPR